MRERKFKAFDNESRMFYDVKKIDFLNGCVYVESDICSKYLYDYVLVEYIGNKDKNNIELYEGDMVKINSPAFRIQKYEYICKIIWSWYSYCFEIIAVNKWEKYQAPPPQSGETIPINEKLINELLVEKIGRIYSKGRQGTEGRIKTLCPHNREYLQVNLWKKNKRYCFLVHRLVAETFLEDFNKELDVDHIDRNRTNNHVSNLRCVTRSENNFNRELKTESEFELPPWVEDDEE